MTYIMTFWTFLVEYFYVNFQISFEHKDSCWFSNSECQNWKQAENNNTTMASSSYDKLKFLVTAYDTASQHKMAVWKPYVLKNT